jgi:hypothetical protein
LREQAAASDCDCGCADLRPWDCWQCDQELEHCHGLGIVHDLDESVECWDGLCWTDELDHIANASCQMVGCRCGSLEG